jgi:pilus assembly protein Flp/PilA
MPIEVLRYLKLRLGVLDSDEEGATMIEYGLLAALLAVTLIGTIAFLSGSLDTIFQTAGDELEAAAAGAGGGG